MANRKSTKKYFFSVEGETEHWYLKWLQDTINHNEHAAYKVSFDCPVQPDPKKRVKSITITGKTDLWHIYDFESNSTEHTDRFKDVMDKMKQAESMGKQITYRFGYSNLTFDLWIVLHKFDCYRSLAHRKYYLQYVNRAFQVSFESMDEYKEERNFKYCLSKLELNDVIMAITRAKHILKANQDNGYTLYKYKGFEYYKENPSLDIWKIIEQILSDCKLL